MPIINPSDFQPTPLNKINNSKQNNQSAIIRSGKGSKLSKLKFLLTISVLIGVYFFVPVRSNFLLLGTDYLPHRDALSRTDTNILITIIPLEPYIGFLSIPRDLWLNIPDVGENRINSAYYFAEINSSGSGPEKVMQTVRSNFGLTIKYFLVINMEGIVKVVDALGGIGFELDSEMGGLPAGIHFLNGQETLAFIRERYSADDFSRMKQGQLVIKSMLKQILTFNGLIRSPLVFFEITKSINTNIPWWMTPRLAFAFIRAGEEGIDYRIITREMVFPFTTQAGAQVLAPNWDLINPVLMEMFGE